MRVDQIDQKMKNLIPLSFSATRTFLPNIFESNRAWIDVLDLDNVPRCAFPDVERTRKNVAEQC